MADVDSREACGLERAGA